MSRVLDRFLGAGGSCVRGRSGRLFAWVDGLGGVPIYDARELAGAMEGLKRLEESIPASEVIYLDLPGDDYAATLDHLYGRPAFAYDRKQFREEVPYLREAGLLGRRVRHGRRGRRACVSGPATAGPWSRGYKLPAARGWV